jgi:nitrate/TMAO reductase-like tetraheme cytochrome c subunit
MSSGWWLRGWARLKYWAATLFIVGLIALATASVGTFAAVHHTARSEFCNSCHIMEPYYQSWQHSPHSSVACIECHYEPGSLETLEGKFKALSQLAKYVTRTQGTKPWAEVSDSSCMRSGCHSVRMLDGPVQFGRIKFDHRQHLLESRRGRRLRCTSCHSQVMQGQHMSVTSSVCFTCHFMPDSSGAVPESSSDCNLCHGPPTGPIDVAGKPFVHADYVERNVDCRECHDPVIEGKGTVRKERCHSCHGEAGHVERIGEREFLHEMHVSEHKVECFECHDEIHHGLLPLPTVEPAAREGCGSCHASPHDSARLLYSGTGAIGVPDAPSRMYLTRVVCEACHTGRTGFQVVTHDAGSSARTAAFDVAHADAAGRAHHRATGMSTVATAGNVDCIHCHGPSFDGMLAEWQAAVGEQLERIGPMLADTRERLDHAAPAAALEALEAAERNYALVALDGSRGAHNVSYALDALRVAAERIDTARSALGSGDAPAAAADFPHRSEQGCTTCHAAAGRPPAIAREERVFPHAKHLAAGLDCGECHSIEEHGKPSFPRNKCASCHHQESTERDANDCVACHRAQSAMLSGTLPMLSLPKPGTMASMECSECHGDAPTILRPKPQSCVLCHEDGYDDMQRGWQREIAESSAKLSQTIAAAEQRGVASEVVARAREALAAVESDGSLGSHNFELAKSLLDDALKALSP